MFKRFVVSGTKKNDVLTGTEDLDVLWGNKGNDVLSGGDGDDFLFGDKGNDQLFGENGNDKLFGGKGKDELSGGEGDDKLFGGKGDDKLFGGEGDDQLFGGKGNDFLDGGAGSDYLFGDKGNDTFNFTLSENDSAMDIYDGGKGRDTLQLTLTTAQLNSESVQKDIADFEAFLARKADSHSDDDNLFHFESFDLTVRNIEALEIVEVGGNAAPVAVDDEFLALTATRGAVSPIKVAVVGGPSSSYILARDQLNDSQVFEIIATEIDYTNSRTWADLNVDNYDVVVLGNSGFDDYAGETGSLFTALNTFVGAGGGVVTTGFFASALYGMRDGTNNVDTPLSLAADAITPITSNPIPATVKGAADITVLPPAHPIVDGLASAYVSNATWHEFAARVNEDEGAVQLATSVVGTNTMTAIAYDADVGPGHGRTAYLGGTYLADSSFFDTGPGSGIREGVSDQIFEQAIAWAAGARGTATVNIDTAVLLDNDTDVDSLRSDFTFVSFTQPGAEGASISLMEDGILVYTLGAQSLQDLMNGNPVSDTFDYTMSDGVGGFDTASVTLAINSLTDAVL